METKTAPLKVVQQSQQIPTLITHHYDDNNIEFSIELALNEAEAKLRLNPYNQNNLEFTRATLIALRNLMNKYSKTREELVHIDSAIQNLESNPVLWIKSLNAYIFGRLNSVYEFGLKRPKTKDWRLRTLERLQIEDKLDYRDPIFNTAKLNPKSNRLLRQDAYIDNFYVTQTKNDLLELIGGVRGMGKSTTAIWKMLYMFEDRGETLSIKNIKRWFETNIVYTNEQSIVKKSMELENDILIIDEGFFVAFNLRSMEREIVNLAQNLNATRNRRNAYFLCMSDLSSTTKPIQRLATGFYWIQRQGYLNKYVKSKNWVNSKDPLGLDEINKAETDHEVDKLLIHHKFYITRMRTTPLPERWYRIYDDIKKKTQDEKGEKDQLKAVSENLDELMVQKAIDAYKSGEKDLMTWFMSKEMPKKIAKKYEEIVRERMYRDHLLEEEEESNIDKKKGVMKDAN